MEYIGIQKKNGGVVEALQQAILSGQIPAGTEMTRTNWQRVLVSLGCRYGRP